MKRGINIIALFRWEIFACVFALAVIVIAIVAGVPLALSQTRTVMKIYADYKILSSAVSLPRKIDEMKKHTNGLDSLVRIYKSRSDIDESAIVKQIYAMSDSAKFVAAKVEILDPIPVKNGVEIPVLLTGSGTYTSIGKLVEAIENLPYTIRVRSIVIKNAGSAIGNVSLDFAITSAQK